MQVDPMKPTLKAPGSERLKLKCDEPLSNFAFKFNLRRYIEGGRSFLAMFDSDAPKAGAYTRPHLSST